MPRRGRWRRLAGVTSLAGVLLLGCGSDSSAAGSTFQPHKADVLTVATDRRPVAGYWGSPDDAKSSGFEQLIRATGKNS